MYTMNDVHFFTFGIEHFFVKLKYKVVMDLNIYSVNGSNSTPVAVIDSRELAQQYWLKYLTTATVFHRRLRM